MTDTEAPLLKKVRLLRLAQQLLEHFRVLEIEPAEWTVVLRFLEALSEKSETTEDAAAFIEQQILSWRGDDTAT